MNAPLLALFGRHNRTQECLLLREERKSRLRRLTSESDPFWDIGGRFMLQRAELIYRA
jgi:hypothetical protein